MAISARQSWDDKVMILMDRLRRAPNFSWFPLAVRFHNGLTEFLNQLLSSRSPTAPVHPPIKVTGPPELHHVKGRYLVPYDNGCL